MDAGLEGLVEGMYPVCCEKQDALVVFQNPEKNW